MTEGITPPQPPDRPAPATYNDRQDVGVRPCAACGGQLEFDIARQQLTCTHCGAGEAIVDTPGAVVAEQSFAKAAAVTNNAHQIQGLVEGEKEIICQNCGGHTTFVGTWTATRCPYCATDLQRTNIHDAPERLAVDGVLPFQVSDKQAAELLDQWINKRWFAPNEFKKYSNAGSFESVYSAYFTFDADTMTDYQGERGQNRTRTYRDGNETKTVVETDWYRVRPSAELVRRHHGPGQHRVRRPLRRQARAVAHPVPQTVQPRLPRRAPVTDVRQRRRNLLW
ncbi:MAG: hypothetical protein R2710_20750 [Acidimicrobiales bacterium]